MLDESMALCPRFGTAAHGIFFFSFLIYFIFKSKERDNMLACVQMFFEVAHNKWTASQN